MRLTYKIIDFFNPYINERIQNFGLKEGMTVIDYGCGPGRYTTKFAGKVGEKGKVYAIDIHELAIEDVVKQISIEVNNTYR